jgi:hypothetical protein
MNLSSSKIDDAWRLASVAESSDPRILYSESAYQRIFRRGKLSELDPDVLALARRIAHGINAAQ